MKSIIPALFICMSINLNAQTPSKPTNPFPNRPGSTTKTSTPAPVPSTPIPSPTAPPIQNAPKTTPAPSTSTVPVVTAPSIPNASSIPFPAISGNDQEQIMMTVMRVFEGMRLSDSNRIKPLFTSTCRLFTAATSANGTPTLMEESIASFIQSVGTARKELIDERIMKYKVDIDGMLAQVWADYNLYIDNKFYHCGVDVFQLYKSTTGWKIFELADTRRKTGCNNDPKDDVAAALDKWHIDAAASNADAYFGAFTPDGIFLGTDASERWTREEFRAWAKPQFDAKKAWNFKPGKRNVYVNPDQSMAWFDEELTTWMGPCRGSGVLAKTSEGWKIKQYNLTILVANEKLQDYLKLIGMK